MACEEWRGKIDSYADAGLPAEEMRAFDRHLAACPSCAADALARVQWKRAAQLAGKRYAPSAEFRRRIEQQIARRQRPAWLGAWVPALATAAVVLIVAVVLVNRWRGSQREIARAELAELTDLHVATLASASPVDVVSTDHHTVKPWFAGRIPFTFNLPELAGTPFTLLGGRVAYLDQAPGAQLLFQVRQHRISVFIFQDRGGVGRAGLGELSSNRLSFNVQTWSEGGLRYFVISDVGADDIRELSRLLKAAAQP